MGWNWKGESPVQVLFDSPDSLLASFLSGEEPGLSILVLYTGGVVPTAFKTCKNLEFGCKSLSLHFSAWGKLSGEIHTYTK
jgi:hypothetical protein